MPEALFGLKMMDYLDCEVEDVYRLLKADAILSDRLMTLVRTAMFGSGRNEPINLEDVIVRLGVKQVMDMVYALKLPKRFKKCKVFGQVELWKHSLEIAFIARSMARKVFAKKVEKKIFEPSLPAKFLILNF